MTMRLNAPPYVYQILDKESPGGTTKCHFLVNEFWSLQKKKNQIKTVRFYKTGTDLFRHPFFKPAWWLDNK
jgi:hypothetical protein